jgi:hypothetical protein
MDRFLDVMGKVYIRLPFGNDGRGTGINGWALLALGILVIMGFNAFG